MAKKQKKSRTQSSNSGLAVLEDGVQNLIHQFADLFSKDASDIVEAIKKDHEGLRNFLGLLKDPDKDMAERRRAYAAFSALLKSHSQCEEIAVYNFIKKLAGREMHLKATEGFVEHRLADDLMARIEKARDPMVWSAHANVLAEIVDHHLKEEESDFLPLVRKTATTAQDAQMLKKFITLRRKTQKKVTGKNAGVLKK